MGDADDAATRKDVAQDGEDVSDEESGGTPSDEDVPEVISVPGADKLAKKKKKFTDAANSSGGIPWGMLFVVVILVAAGAYMATGGDIGAFMGDDDALMTDENASTGEAMDENGSVVNPGASDAPETPDEINTSALERAIHVRINDRRLQNDLEPLSIDPELVLIARNYSKQMADANYLSHTSRNGETYADRYDAAGYECKATKQFIVYDGEQTIAKVDAVSSTKNGVVTYRRPDAMASAIVNSWMNDWEPEGKILAEYWDGHGIGAYVDENDMIYVTQNFC